MHAAATQLMYVLGGLQRRTRAATAVPTTSYLAVYVHNILLGQALILLVLFSAGELCTGHISQTMPTVRANN